MPGSSVEWVARPSSRGSSQPKDQTRVSLIAGGFFTTEPLGKHLQTILNINSIKKELKGLPWWSSGEDCAPNAEGPGFIPPQGARPYMPQLKLLHAAMKTEDPTCCNEDLVQPT